MTEQAKCEDFLFLKVFYKMFIFNQIYLLTNENCTFHEACEKNVSKVSLLNGKYIQ